MIVNDLPRLRCARRSFGGDPPADREGAEWQGCEAVALRDVITGSVPRQRTEVLAAWSADELRVLFVAEDADPWATFTERDAPLYQEEVLEIFIDPVGDGAGYFEFEVNPLNAVLDLVVRRNRSGLLKDFAWQCEGLRTAVRTVANGWAAEFAIPFRSLVAELPQAGARWRINFCRIDRPRSGGERELSAWSTTGRPQFHVPERFGWLEFSSEE